jgi:YYY domain-containing protein
MISFFVWYFIITILGWLSFPLAHTLFPALADRGYTLSRAAGLLIWGYIFWLLASLGIAQNDMGGILLALAFIIGLSVWSIANHKSDIIDFFKSKLSLIVITEVLFFIAFAFLAFVRSANPELISTEKPMELAFINGILRSPTFPPQDPWLSGYAISYYYFGYVMTAMLARVSGINGSMAHNLMTSLIFALGAVGSYGILYNLLSRKDRRSEIDDTVHRPLSTVYYGLLAPLFLLLVSNFGALLEVLHRRGFFWVKDAVTGEYSSSFWKWLDMKELSQPPFIPFQWQPDRYLWWWRASRVIQDYDMVGGFREVIDEFPFFSFLLGDLHPHVLAIPFSLLAISVALNLYFGGFRGAINLFRARLHISLSGFLFSALVIGGLAFLNTWDILVGATLIVAAYIFWRANEDGWRWDRLEDLFLLSLPLGIVSILLYFPFYLGFSSQAGGILPNFMYPTRGIHLWVMWGTLFIPIFAYLIYLSSGVKQIAASSVPTISDSLLSDSRVFPNWKLGFSLGLGFTFLLFLLTLSLGWIGSFVEKDFVQAFLSSQNMNAVEFLSATSLRRLSYIGSLITLLAVLIPALSFLFAEYRHTEVETDQLKIVNRKSKIANQFVLLLITIGIVLVIAPEFVYLRDQFGYRINTVFKFYYQAWMLLSLAAAFGVSVLLQNLRGIKNILFRILIGFVIFSGLLYPVFGILTKTNNFKPYGGFTLDDFDRIVRENPDEATAIEFLRSVPDGVITEAVGDGYSGYARISTHTGLQTVLGWPGHESQWRGSYQPQGSRREDISKLYATTRWEEAQAIIEKYNIRYIYIGILERTSLPVSEAKFQTYLKPIFQQGETVIYEVP